MEQRLSMLAEIVGPKIMRVLLLHCSSTEIVEALTSLPRTDEVIDILKPQSCELTKITPESDLSIFSGPFIFDHEVLDFRGRTVQQ